MVPTTPSRGSVSRLSASAPRWRPLFGWLGRLSGSMKLSVLVVSAAVLAASVLLATRVVVGRMGERAEAGVQALERDNVQREAQQIERRLRGFKRSLTAALVNWTFTGPATVQHARAFLAERPVLTAAFSSVFVVAPDGRMLSLRDAEGLHEVSIDLADRPYFQRTLAERRAVLSEPVISRFSHQPLVVLTMPIQSASGALLGVLCGAVRLAEFELGSPADEGRGALRTIVADADGHILAHPQRERLMQDVESEPALRDLAQRDSAAARALGSGVRSGLLSEVQSESQSGGQSQAKSWQVGESIVSMAAVPGFGWTVIRIADTNMLLGEPARARAQAWLLAAAFAVCGGLLIAAVLSRLLRPLRELERRAHALLDGSLPDDQGWPAPRGEIGALSRVLQHVMRERAQAERSTNDLLHKMRSVMTAAPIGIAFVRHRRFELVSREYAALLGWEPEEMIGETAERFFADPQAYQTMRQRVVDAFAADHNYSEEFRFVRKDGSQFWGRTQGRPVERGHPGLGTIWLLADVSQEREARERLTWSATHDALTRLLNRSAFELALRERLAARVAGQHAALLYIDLDRFKLVNDSAGHAAGDAVLEQVAQVLSHRVRTTDMVGRMGGDEFAVLLAGCDRALALRIAEQIRQGIEDAHVMWMGQRLTVGASIGVVEVPDHAFDTTALLAAADAACYEAKHAGRNTVREARSGAAGLRLVAGGGTPAE